MMMFERFALQFVDKYLSPYAEVDPEEVCAGIRRGQVVLRNVKLKTSAFAALGLPLTVYGGKIGELQMRMNMRCLRAAPASIVLRDVDVVIGPAGTMASGSVR